MDSTILAFFFIAFVSTTTKAFDPCPSLKPKSDGSDLSIIHIYGKCSPFDSPKPTSWATTVLNMAAKDPQRLTYLSNMVATKPVSSVPIAPGQVINVGNYVARVKIGTPGQLMFMVLDTSADTAWVPCTGCTGCSSTMFSQNMSTTYGSLDCATSECVQARGLSCPTAGPTNGNCLFNQSYGGDSSFSATLSRDSLQLANDIIPSYVFGCIGGVSGNSIPPQGLLGLGRGSMSLLSQSGSLYSGVFSYCLPSFRSYYFSGSLKLGPNGQPKTIKFTPLLKNPHRPSLYYVNLTGISVGRVNVPIAPELLDFNPNTGAGTIIDSGTVITRFVPAAYNAIKEAFRNQTQGPFSSLGAFDTCFSVTHENVAPKMTFHFTGLDIVLPMENTLIHSSAGTLACLAMASAPDNVNSVLNVIANLQQQNLRILFDVANSRVGIAREICN
ncbi:aspartyl protease AED3 [Cynara cardunculus var. scolymus]|uniref:Aspartic peptidase n=1 Tax=Cynara cardunculus var. scolymus TaxID=59895 RepID=A0A118K405_CYNCS|nr:aspartyl protease AED3 [Cynara cardunculus var. scolymus]KVI06750.1 Aspartic peptidase [Cynara cardunculus var. scolymus]